MRRIGIVVLAAAVGACSDGGRGGAGGAASAAGAAQDSAGFAAARGPSGADTAVEASAPGPDTATSRTRPPAGDTLAEGPREDGGGWTSGVLRRDRETEVAVLAAVRVARHEAFDRLVLEFMGPVPGYRVESGAGPVHECGSGEPVELGTGAVVEVALFPAAAHDEEGHATVTERDRSPGLPVIRRLRSICDFEGHVGWAVGVPAGVSYRILELGDPPRLVLDFRR